MNTIVVKVNDASKTVAEHYVVFSDANPTIIKASGNVNYELINQDTGLAPHHIITTRLANDLIIAFDKKGVETDLVIEDFYKYSDSALIGQTSTGDYYYYIPDTAEVSDYVTQLVDADSQGNALGGPSQSNPWWIGVENDGVGIWPWLLGLAGLGLGAAALADDDDDDTSIDNSSDAPVITAEDIGGITVVPGEDNVTLVVDYQDEEDNIEQVILTKDPTSGEWTSEEALPEGVEIDPTTGTVTIDPNEVKDETKVEATGTAPDKDPATEEGLSKIDAEIDITQIAGQQQIDEDIGDSDNYATINLSQSKTTVISGTSSSLDTETVTITLSDATSTITTTAVIANDGTWTTEAKDISQLNEGQLTIKASVDTISDIDLAVKDTDGTNPNNSIAFIDPNDDGVLNAAENINVALTAQIEAAGSVNSIVISDDDPDTIDITVASSSITVAAEGKVSVTGLDLSSLTDGELKVTMTAADQYDNPTGNISNSINKDTLINKPVFEDSVTNPDYPLSEKTGGVFIKAPTDLDLSSLTITYTDETRPTDTNSPHHSLTLVKNGENWLLTEESTLQSGVIINSNGEVEIVSDRLLDGSNLTATYTDSSGNTATEDTHLAINDHTSGGGYRETDNPLNTIIAIRGTANTDLDQDVDSYIFSDFLSNSAHDVSSDGYFSIVKTADGKAVLNLTDKGFASECNDYAVGSNNFQYSIEAIKDGVLIFEFDMSVNLYSLT